MAREQCPSRNCNSEHAPRPKIGLGPLCPHHTAPSQASLCPFVRVCMCARVRTCKGLNNCLKSVYVCVCVTSAVHTDICVYECECMAVCSVGCVLLFCALTKSFTLDRTCTVPGFNAFPIFFCRQFTTVLFLCIFVKISFKFYKIVEQLLVWKNNIILCYIYMIIHTHSLLD